ncbi:thioredoxin [Flavobacterium rivuli WB 3.3-2 = DSM 21788]|uniref:Thioredoxin n=1 Tax=Flavobacterium rivuli WB 3.3-2 = DSM 21788 TaxID=1121895 RepID=A0A0A2M3I2_9FLAO|nr:thioredoxin [Flavobacterium rivuli]KGO86839.1 thioredoxin [Flavobacterium rivuli WB 3.3-2 = DSM 21788]
MNSFSTLINSSEPVLIDFFATWCGPCQMMAPILKDVKESLGDKIKIIKVDVDKNQALMSTPQFQVKGVPTLMLFQNGKMLWRQSGVVPKDDIIRTILSFQTQSQSQ